MQRKGLILSSLDGSDFLLFLCSWHKATSLTCKKACRSRRYRAIYGAQVHADPETVNKHFEKNLGSRSDGAVSALRNPLIVSILYFYSFNSYPCSLQNFVKPASYVSTSKPPLEIKSFCMYSIHSTVLVQLFCFFAMI